MDIEGAVAVITGAGSGIGRATALALARAGADVVLADVREDRVAEVEREIGALGRRALPVMCDVSKDADVERLGTEAIGWQGHVDVLHNNAGIILGGLPEAIPIQEWERILNINLLGVVRACRVFLPHLMEQGKGHVVNTASIAGLYAFNPYAAPYIVSKFALVGLSQALAVYLKPRGVGVSVMCPGVIHTNLNESWRIYWVGGRLLPPLAVESLSAGFASDFSIGEPDEVAQIIVEQGIQKEQFLLLTSEENRQGLPEHAKPLVERAREFDLLIDEATARLPNLAPGTPLWNMIDELAKSNE